jgi:hypothetical protein
VRQSIFAYTSPGGLSPEYISVKSNSDGGAEITVRSLGGGLASIDLRPMRSWRSVGRCWHASPFSMNEKNATPDVAAFAIGYERNAKHRHRRLLRARPNRPNRRAAEFSIQCQTTAPISPDPRSSGLKTPPTPWRGFLCAIPDRQLLRPRSHRPCRGAAGEGAAGARPDQGVSSK